MILMPDLKSIGISSQQTPVQVYHFPPFFAILPLISYHKVFIGGLVFLTLSKTFPRVPFP